MKTSLFALAVTGALFAGVPSALAQSGGAPSAAVDPGTGADSGGSADSGGPADSASKGAAPSRGSFLAGALVGGLAPFDGLDPFVVGTIELGYVLPFLDRSFAGLVAVSYTAPGPSGTESDPRVPGGQYRWELTQHELVIQPTLMYRYTKLGRLVPFVGIGPRIYLMKSVVKGEAGGVPIGETSEPSTQIGGGLPLGVEYQLGPGALTGELLFEIGTLEHAITGNSHTGGLSLNLGYRFLL
ncbi:MAG: hypothetical protein R3B70_48025 [Polyangiaceae bacterium]